MGFSIDDSVCRIWKLSGKWYETIEVKFRHSDWEIELIHKAFKNALRDSIPDNYHGMMITCLEPYHKYSHPISIIWEG